MSSGNRARSSLRDRGSGSRPRRGGHCGGLRVADLGDPVFNLYRVPRRGSTDARPVSRGRLVLLDHDFFSPHDEGLASGQGHAEICFRRRQEIRGADGSPFRPFLFAPVEFDRIGDDPVPQGDFPGKGGSCLRENRQEQSGEKECEKGFIYRKSHGRPPITLHPRADYSLRS
jgi:hypothetical protein